MFSYIRVINKISNDLNAWCNVATAGRHTQQIPYVTAGLTTWLATDIAKVHADQSYDVQKLG